MKGLRFWNSACISWRVWLCFFAIALVILSTSIWVASWRPLISSEHDSRNSLNFSNVSCFIQSVVSTNYSQDGDSGISMWFCEIPSLMKNGSCLSLSFSCFFASILAQRSPIMVSVSSTYLSKSSVIWLSSSSRWCLFYSLPYLRYSICCNKLYVSSPKGWSDSKLGALNFLTSSWLSTFRILASLASHL